MTASAKALRRLTLSRQQDMPPDARESQFVSTYFISYTGKNGITVTGNAGFEAAVRQGYFRVIAYDDTVTVPLSLPGGTACRIKATISGALSTAGLQLAFLAWSRGGIRGWRRTAAACQTYRGHGVRNRNS